MNIPNSLTLLRIASIPIVLYLYDTSNYIVCAIVVFLACLTDFFDGHLARRLNQSTPLGALLDPVADKFFEMSFTVLLGLSGSLPWYYVFLLNLRNFSQLLPIPVLIWWKKIHFKVEPAPPSKYGSALGMIVIGWVILYKIFDLTAMLYPLSVLVAVSAGFEVYILITFLPRFRQIYKGEHDTFN